MLKYTTIMCPYDFDENSTPTLHLAGALAKESKATLYVVHIAKVPAPDMDVPLPFGTHPRWEKEAEARLVEIVDQTLEVSVSCKIVVRSGIPDIDIVRVAKELKVDLIVMATHGRRGIGHLVFGSVTEHVIREATCPVLVIRPERTEVAHPQGRSGAPND